MSLLLTPDELPSGPDLLGLPSPEFEHDGKSYSLRKPTQLEQAMFSRWLERRAQEAAGRSIDLPEEVQDKLIRNLNNDIASGEFEYGSPAYISATLKPFGLAKLVSLMLTADGHAEVTHEAAIEMVMNKYKQIAGDVLGRAKDDPKVVEALGILFGESSASST